MKYKLALLAALFVILGCSNPNEDTLANPVVLKYNNIMIYSDLSNRLEKSPNDQAVINQLLGFFVSDCVKPGIKINDRSAISFSRINAYNSQCQSPTIDIDEVKDLRKKQAFVNDKSTGKTLSKEIQNFRNSVNCVYTEKDNGGLDILSLIHSEISNGNRIKQPVSLRRENGTITITYNNHLILFTDGYLEYSKKDGDDRFYFGETQIQKIRAYCKANNVSPGLALQKNPDFKIPSLKSPNNPLVNLYILETYDRGLNKEKGTIKNSGELSDNNILKTVWAHWAKESNFKSFSWKQQTSGSLPKDYIKSLIVQ